MLVPAGPSLTCFTFSFGGSGGDSHKKIDQILLFKRMFFYTPPLPQTSKLTKKVDAFFFSQNPIFFFFQF